LPPKKVEARKFEFSKVTNVVQPAVSSRQSQIAHESTSGDWSNCWFSIERNPFPTKNQTLRSYRVHISPI